MKTIPINSIVKITDTPLVGQVVKTKRKKLTRMCKVVFADGNYDWYAAKCLMVIPRERRHVA